MRHGTWTYVAIININLKASPRRLLLVSWYLAKTETNDKPRNRPFFPESNSVNRYVFIHKNCLIIASSLFNHRPSWCCFEDLLCYARPTLVHNMFPLSVKTWLYSLTYIGPNLGSCYFITRLLRLGLYYYSPMLPLILSSLKSLLNQTKH